MSQAREAWNAGYRDGYSGRITAEEAAKRGDDYFDGWDVGNCDRPSLDDLMPLNALTEATNWHV